MPAPVKLTSAPNASPFDLAESHPESWRPPAHAYIQQPPALPQPVAPPREDVHTDQTRYFVITSNNEENVVKSVRHSLWATQRKNEQRLDEAYRTASAVMLVFSVNRSEAFQGYARMGSAIGRPRSRSVDPFNGFGRLFDVEWLRLHDLSYREVEHLRNPLNGDRPVHNSRDGQELSNATGRKLCQLIDRHIDEPDSFAPPQAPVSHPPAATVPALLADPVDAVSLPTAGKASDRGKDGSARSRSRKRRREKRYRKAPHALDSSLEEQLEYFLTLDFEDYCEWWDRYGSVDPGPIPPPGVPALAPKISELNRGMMSVRPTTYPPNSFQHSHAGMPPMMFGVPPMDPHHCHPCMGQMPLHFAGQMPY